MNIGLIAHDSKKTLMQNFCIAYRGILTRDGKYVINGLDNWTISRRSNKSYCS